MIPPPAKNRIRKGNIWHPAASNFLPSKNHKSIMYIHTYTHISYTVHISYRYTCTWHEIYTYLLHSSIIYNMSIIYIHINTRKFVGSECPRKATLDLASLYAFCWQSLERAERSMDSERLLCVAQMLCRWIETAPRVVDGSGELPAFRFFFEIF